MCVLYSLCVTFGLIVKTPDIVTLLPCEARQGRILQVRVWLHLTLPRTQQGRTTRKDYLCMTASNIYPTSKA